MTTIDGCSSRLDGTPPNRFPSALSQKNMWQRARHPAENIALNIPMRWVVEGRLSHTDTERALNMLMQRHEILRTSFHELDGQLHQVVQPTLRLRVRDVDLTFVAAAQRMARAEAIAKEEAREPIDARLAPLWRATLIRLAPDKSVLLLTFHALVIDGWSINLMLREFREFAVSETTTLPVPDLQFADYALWESETLACGALDDSRAFWRQHLRGAVATQVAPDSPRGLHATGVSEISSKVLSVDVARAAEAFARERGVTMFGLAATSLAIALHNITGEQDVVFGTQVANREDPSAHDIIGPVANSITLRVPVHGGMSFGEILDRAWKSIQNSIEHQRFPLWAVEEEGTSPPHAINLVVQRAYSDISALETANPVGFKMLPLPSLSSGALWDLNFFMINRREGWRLSCEVNVDLYTTATADRLLTSWLRCLEALVLHPAEIHADCVQSISHRKETAPPLERKRTDPLFSEDAPSRRIVRFNADGRRTPIIALNTHEIYFHLAEQLGADRPFIDIQLDHPDGPFDFPNRAFEDYAADAVRIIRWGQPKGPYALCGFCTNGVLAFEVARQLRRQGEQVALVALFDSWAPQYRESMPPWDRWLRRAQLRLHHLKNGELRAKLAYYSSRLRQLLRGDVSAREIFLLPILRRLSLAPQERANEALQHPAHWYYEYLLAARSDYRPRPFQGDVVVFRSRTALRGRLFDDRLGWGPLVAGKLLRADINSEHQEMFKEQGAREIAAHLQTILAEIEGH